MSSSLVEQEILGVGWRFPVQIMKNEKDQTNRIAVSDHEQLVEQSIIIILGTAKGERIARPDFGSDLKRLVFAPNNASTAGLAIYYVQQALQQWEPRIDVLDVDANPDPINDMQLLINIEYKVIVTNNIRNLVYPFYLGSM